LCFLYGKSSFARHWLFFQEAVDMVSRFRNDFVKSFAFFLTHSPFIDYPLQFNAANPAGNVVESERYLHFLVIGVGVGFVVATKRFWVGLFLGRQTFCKYISPSWKHSTELHYVLRYSQSNAIITIVARYADDLAKVMKKNLLIGQVATLARDMEKLYDHGVAFDSHAFGDSKVYKSLLANADEEGSTNESMTGPQVMKSAKSGLNDVAGGSEGFVGSGLTGSQKLELNQLLGAFEEPQSVNSKNVSACC
jgi:hypothetical protein